MTIGLTKIKAAFMIGISVILLRSAVFAETNVSNQNSGGTYENKSLKVTGIASSAIKRADPQTGLQMFIAKAAAGGSLHAVFKLQNATFDAKQITAEMKPPTLTVMNAIASGSVKADFMALNSSGSVSKSEIMTEVVEYLKTSDGAKLTFPSEVNMEMVGSEGNALGTLHGEKGTFIFRQNSKGSLEPAYGSLIGSISFRYSSLEPQKDNKPPQKFSLSGTANQLDFLREVSGNYQLKLTGDVHIHGSLGDSVSEASTDTIVIELSPQFKPLEMNSNSEPTTGIIYKELHLGSREKTGRSGN